MIGETRRAVSSDGDGLFRCIGAAYAPFADIGLPDVAAGIADDIETNLVWVHVIEGQIVGGVVVVSGAGTYAHLQNVAVHPDFGGLGIGSALIDTAMAYLIDLGVAEVRLVTHVAMPKNVEFYQRLGWSETGREDNKIRMARQLS